jgi:hypothetical protein
MAPERQKERKQSLRSLADLYPGENPARARWFARRVDEELGKLFAGLGEFAKYDEEGMPQSPGRELRDRAVALQKIIECRAKLAQIQEIADKKSEPWRRLSAVLNAQQAMATADPMAPDTVTKAVGPAFAMALQGAMQAGDWKAAADIAAKYADASGASAPKKVELSTAATPAEAARLVREAFGDKAATGGSGGDSGPAKT